MTEEATRQAMAAERRAELLAAMTALIDEWMRGMSGSPSEVSPPIPKCFAEVRAAIQFDKAMEGTSRSFATYKLEVRP